jgi:hypothetical protein
MNCWEVMDSLAPAGAVNYLAHVIYTKRYVSSEAARRNTRKTFYPSPQKPFKIIVSNLCKISLRP